MKHSMHRFACFSAVLLFQPLLNSCADFGSSMSLAADTLQEQNGSVCIDKLVTPASYNEETGQYVDNTMAETTKDGRNIRSEEETWLEARSRYYSDMSTGAYYDDSPVSNVRYRFTVKCLKWETRSQPSYNNYNNYNGYNSYGTGSYGSGSYGSGSYGGDYSIPPDNGFILPGVN